MTVILTVFGRFLLFFMIFHLHLDVFFDIALTFFCFLRFFRSKMKPFAEALAAVAADGAKTIKKAPFSVYVRYA